MRIAVVGTGANGAGIGADLIRAGLDVTFIEQWPEHVVAMRRRGVEVRTPAGTEVTGVEPLHLCEVATLRTPFDLVFIIVKAYDTRWAVELMKPHVAPDGLVVGLQNGMTVDDIASIVGPGRTLGAVIEISAAMWEPGIVERHVPREGSWFALGGIHPTAHARVAEVADILGCAGTVEPTDDIRSAKWMKLVVNAAELVPTAIVNEPMRTAAALPGMREYMLRAGEEAMRAAVAAGHTPRPIFGLPQPKTDDPMELVAPLIDKVFDHFALDETTTTVHQDWVKGRHSELEEINGLVVSVLDGVGESAPANSAALLIGREIEAGRSQAGHHQLDRLLASIR